MAATVRNAAVELYARIMTTPSELQPRKRDSQCGTIVVWTKDAWP